MIEANKNQGILTADISNVFVQIPIEQEKYHGKIMMKIKGGLIDILAEINLETCSKFITIENAYVLIINILKTLYGTLISAVLYYKK